MLKLMNRMISHFIVRLLKVLVDEFWGGNLVLSKKVVYKKYNCTIRVENSQTFALIISKMNYANSVVYMQQQSYQSYLKRHWITHELYSICIQPGCTKVLKSFATIIVLFDFVCLFFVGFISSCL